MFNLRRLVFISVLVIGSIGIFAFVPGPAQASFVEESSGASVYALFESTDGNLQRQVFVSAYEESLPVWGDRSVVYITISETRNGRRFTTMTGSVALTAGQLEIDGTNGATLNAVVPMCYYNRHNKPMKCTDVGINIVWTGWGTPLASSSTVYNEFDGCTVTTENYNQTREAYASGSVVRNGENLAPADAFSADIIQWQTIVTYGDGCVVIATP